MMLVMLLGLGSIQAQPAGFPAFVSEPALLEILERSADTVRVRHGYGKTAIPRAASRIIAADETTLDYLLALGITPVAVTSYSAELPDYLVARAPDVTVIPVSGGPTGVSLEALAALTPDLIIGYEHLGGNGAPELYAQVSRIAPTVSFLAPPETALRSALPLLAEIFGVADVSTQVLATYEAELKSYRDRLKVTLGDMTVSFVTIYPRLVRLYGVGYEAAGVGYIPHNVTAPLYQELDLTPGPEVARLTLTTGRADISFETLAELEADYLLVFTTLNPNELTENPVWQLIPAVQRGQAGIIQEDSIWLGGYWGNLNRLAFWSDTLLALTERTE
jgi:iron complex transport system substrate-binding protein